MSLLRWLKEVRAGGDPPRKETVMDNESKIRAMLAAASNSLLARVLEDTLNKKELDVIFPWLGAEIRETRLHRSMVQTGHGRVLGHLPHWAKHSRWFL